MEALTQFAYRWAWRCITKDWSMGRPCLKPVRRSIVTAMAAAIRQLVHGKVSSSKPIQTIIVSAIRAGRYQRAGAGPTAIPTTLWLVVPIRACSIQRPRRAGGRRRWRPPRYKGLRVAHQIVLSKAKLPCDLADVTMFVDARAVHAVARHFWIPVDEAHLGRERCGLSPWVSVI